MANDTDDSFVVNLAKSILPGEEAAQELDEELDRIVPNAGGSLIDSFFGGAVGGTAINIANARDDMREKSESHHDPDQPLIESRTRELDDGRMGTWIYVDAPSVETFLSPRSILLRGDGWQEELQLSFMPGEVERVESGGESVSEFVVAPPAQQAPSEPELEPDPEPDSDNYMDYVDQQHDDNDDDDEE